MARTPKAVADLVREAGVDTAAAGVYTTIDATLVTNGLSITGAGAKRGRLVLHVKNTAGTAKVVTVQKGAHQSAPANAAAAVSVPAAGERMILLAESALHEQADESVWVDFAAGTTGSVAVFRV